MLGLNKSEFTKLIAGVGVLVLLASLLMIFVKFDSAVSGVIVYDNSVALPQGSKLSLQLRDTSYADASSILITEKVIVDPGPSPLSFYLPYKKADIDSRNTYSISARIVDPDGRLLFINDTSYEVITRSKPSKVEMELKIVNSTNETLPETDETDGMTN